MPGVAANDIDVKFDSGDKVLYLSGKLKNRDYDSKTEYHFERKFRIKSSVNMDKASAIHEYGVLIVTVPKKEEANKVVRIAVTESKRDALLSSTIKETEKNDEDDPLPK